MTSIAHRYADFSAFDPDGQPIDPVPMDRVEDEKLQSFEEGYQAGWTDAEKTIPLSRKLWGRNSYIRFVTFRLRTTKRSRVSIVALSRCSSR